MADSGLNEEQIRTKIKDFCDNPVQCGLEAFVVKKDSPKLKRMSLSEKENEDGKNLEQCLKKCFLKFLKKNFCHRNLNMQMGIN
ncbi:MAG: hypothetical protein NC247_04650 [Ruminococcus flavefaciens]|nr:hypothetical protein [Ruminococcus flavefaciens]